jgi:hypothetical protein
MVPVLEQQIVVGGLRLAKLLEKYFKVTNVQAPAQADNLFLQ